MSVRRKHPPAAGGGGAVPGSGAAGGLSPESERVFWELVDHIAEDLARIYAEFPRGVESGRDPDSRKLEA